MTSAVARTPPPARMSYEEFLAWADEDTYAEWVDGAVLLMSPASRRHQQLAGFLLAILQHFVESQNSGVVIAAPFQMKTAPQLPGREPDILFVAKERLEHLKSTRLDGAADLAIEIISPESRARDRGEKFYEYEQGGVREYWLIDPAREQAEFYLLGADGIFRPVAPDAEGIFHSRTLGGLRLRVDWLWQEPLPPLLAVLKEWKLV